MNDNEQENEQNSITIAPEIMGDYVYSNQSYIKPKKQWWIENGYKLKFIIPASLFVLYCLAELYLEVIA